jgi:hypothetical protein
MWDQDLYMKVDSAMPETMSHTVNGRDEWTCNVSVVGWAQSLESAPGVPKSLTVDGGDVF